MVIANKIRRLLKRNSKVHTVLGREAVAHAAKIMSEHNVGCLVVVGLLGVLDIIPLGLSGGGSTSAEDGASAQRGTPSDNDDEA